MSIPSNNQSAMSVLSGKARSQWQDDPRVFDGVRFGVHAIDLNQRSGGTHRREVVVPRDAVVILPLMEDGRVVLIRNERFAVGQTLWELPAGTLEPGEDPAMCAGRELEEETGYRASKVEPMLAYYPSPGFCTELLSAFVATGLTHVGQSLDETERIEVHAVSKAEALAMIRDNRICDAKTIAALLYYEVFLHEQGC